MTDIVAGAMAGGLDGLPERVPLTVGIPLHPTLGSPVRSLDEIYDRLNDMPFAAEFKYDGQRAQIHASKAANDDPSVHIFSRHLENMTEKIVALDPNDSSLRSFQELSSRARKDVNIRDIRVSVCVFAFDLMYFNGEAASVENSVPGPDNRGNQTLHSLSMSIAAKVNKDENVSKIFGKKRLKAAAKAS
ncbi:hypothetical protein JVU11DRAFT_4136 [Chiua virens]|nr:hypothetical protein JVU11DRAFT_4136 [Chiua virens]